MRRWSATMPAVRVSLVAEFRVLVEVAAPGDDAGGHVRGAPVDLGLQRGGRLAGRRQAAGRLSQRPPAHRAPGPGLFRRTHDASGLSSKRDSEHPIIAAFEALAAAVLESRTMRTLTFAAALLLAFAAAPRRLNRATSRSVRRSSPRPRSRRPSAWRSARSRSTRPWAPPRAGCATSRSATLAPAASCCGRCRRSETPQKIRSESEKAKIATSDATGFGPGAFYAVGSYGVVQLNAFKGSTQVMVQLMLMTQPPDQVTARRWPSS